MEDYNFTVTSWSVAGSISNKDRYNTGAYFYVRITNTKNEEVYKDHIKINSLTTGNDYEDLVINSVRRYVENI